MPSVNKVFLLGNLTRDPELRYTPNGVAVADLGVAVNRVFQTKEGERREEVTFVDVTVWNRQAENCCQYLKKGQPVHVEGYLKMDSWEDKATGAKRSKLKVEAENVQFLAGRRDEAGGGSPSSAGYDDEATAREPRRAGPGNGASRGGGYPAAGGQAGPTRRPAPPAEPEDEDIPF